MNHLLIAAFNYEIINHIDTQLDMCKKTSLSSPLITSMVMHDTEELEKVKKYLLSRLNTMKQEEKKWEDKLINGNK